MEIVNRPAWDDASRVEYPTLRGEVTADVCVIGLGGSGLACILELLARGKSVVGLDATRIAAGAAGRNGGFLLGGLAMFHHDAVARLGRAAASALYRATLTELERMSGEMPQIVRRTGSLRIAASPEELEDCRAQFEAMRADGLPVQQYDAEEGRGLFFPRDAGFDPAARCRALARAAADAGARLYEASPAIELGEGVVRTPDGAVRARDVIVAVDGNLERILPELSPRVRTARLQMLATAPLSRTVFPKPVYSRWGLDYWQQLPDRRVVLGGARDVGGDAEWTSSTEPTSSVQAALELLLRERLRVDAPITHRWAASVSYTETGLPIVEQVRAHVWAVGAYSGTGNVLGALAGRAAAELVATGASETADLLRA
ncbi:MAG: FAD-binding oxidoreductase [Gemmatimonadaceae bacterium]